MADGDQVLLVEGLPDPGRLDYRVWLEVVGWLAESGQHARLIVDPTLVQRIRDDEPHPAESLTSTDDRVALYHLARLRAIGLEPVEEGIRVIDWRETARLRRLPGTSALSWPRAGTEVVVTGIVIETGRETVIAPRGQSDLVFQDAAVDWPVVLPRTGHPPVSGIALDGVPARGVPAGSIPALASLAALVLLALGLGLRRWAAARQPNGELMVNQTTTEQDAISPSASASAPITSWPVRRPTGSAAP